MSLSQLLQNAREQAETLAPGALPEGFPAYVLFFSVSTGRGRAHVEIARGETFEKAWISGAQALQKWRKSQTREAIWLRVDTVANVEALSWGNLRQKLAKTKRNYFRFGLAFDMQFNIAILEQELAANAVLYDGNIPVAAANSENLASYGKRRFEQELCWPEKEDEQIWRFTTRAVFCDDKQYWPIEHAGRESGYRKLPNWRENIPTVLHSATQYLAGQVRDDGEYNYGWFPCFDRAIASYNALRHASSTYALLEGWEFTQDQTHRDAIERALIFLNNEIIKATVLPNGKEVAFLVDVDNEIKLGGNAVSILAMAKYTELTGDQRYIPQMNLLAEGILFMQNQETGSFAHILNYPDLSVKAEHRTIYYDGEAAFALMRLYAITREERWVDAVEHAFTYFITEKHWQAHDHWLSYCVNELTRWRPQARYYQFGLDNVRDHLDFVLERVTTYPTLLELMMAAHQMIERIAVDDQHRHLLDNFDREKFELALHYRARYLLNGYFWPELAMFFRNPAKILGSFFIRHHTYRVRIDDVEHYLSGFVAYLKMLRGGTWKKKEQRLVFLAGNLRDIGNGIEVSSMRRAVLLHEKLGITPDILIAVWNPGLDAIVEQFKQQGKLPEEVTVSSIYQHLSDLRVDRKIVPLPALEAELKRVHTSKIGTMTRYRYHNEDKKLCAEDFVDTRGNVLLRHYYQFKEEKVERTHTEIFWCDGLVQYKKEGDMVAALAESKFTGPYRWHLLVDKNKDWRDFLLKKPSQRLDVTITTLIHSTHRLLNGKHKSIYSHFLLNHDLIDNLIVLTDAQRAEIITEGFPDNKLITIPHHLSQEKFFIDKKPGKNIIYLARYSPEKRHDMLIRIFERVVKKIPDARLQTWGTGTLRENLIQQVKDAGLQDNIEINGFTRDIISVHQNACGAVLCSCEEGFSLFALESLNFGTPLVSFDIKYGPGDMLKGFDAGILVKDGDEEEMANALISLIQDPKKQKRQHKQALLSAERYSSENVAKKWQQWWDDVKIIRDI